MLCKVNRWPDEIRSHTIALGTSQTIRWALLRSPFTLRKETARGLQQPLMCGRGWRKDMCGRGLVKLHRKHRTDVKCHSLQNGDLRFWYCVFDPQNVKKNGKMTLKSKIFRIFKTPYNISLCQSQYKISNRYTKFDPKKLDFFLRHYAWLWRHTIKRDFWEF